MSAALQVPAGIVILADLALELDSAALRQRVRAAAGTPLRRAGTHVELVVAGVHACLAALPEQAPRGSTAALWTSRAGVRSATATVLDELCLHDAPPLPFDFLATQAVLAAIPLQHALATLDAALYLPWGGDEALRWPRLLQLAALQLRSARHTLVLCGTVEPGETTHHCRWVGLAQT
ncbi:hypothetical protein [Pseudothauera lacus]|uniref:Uncharacterized protein n=1 Tax=Pseudothauera lacus TaxID=2136175 RepID=A0A2T4IEQ9_9RHOO|nr:hypothetical protein [Pseudothauera lacus]PTD96252.1 hypothetical protein C8261_10045 [Pseudothauera lacus]